MLPVEIVRIPSQTVTNMLSSFPSHSLLLTSPRIWEGLSYIPESVTFLISVLEMTMKSAAGTPLPETSAMTRAR